MKADKIFKKYGWHKQDNPDSEGDEIKMILFYVKDGVYITFFEDKTIGFHCATRGYMTTLNIEEVEAIKLKIKELGWLI